MAKFLSKRGEGLYAVSFRLSRADEGAEDARRKGIRVLRTVENEQLGSVFNMKEVFLHPKDAHGVHILLTEYQTASEARK